MEKNVKFLGSLGMFLVCNDSDKKNISKLEREIEREIIGCVMDKKSYITEECELMKKLLTI